MTCPACGSPNEPGRKFCGECGTPLVRPCQSCGTPNAGTVRFCGECGAPLGGDGAAGGPVAARTAAPVASATRAPGAPAEPPARQTERRVVSVLFADMVGFTTRSDGTDPEQVREFLSRYFALARETVERYGGTVEKFIGDAVMAVWGAPVAQEDDAERAVRAGLELVDAVRHLGRQLGGEELQVRAGVLTGEAAVAVGVVGEGMVAGDLVNTASRLQSVAPPGAVLVGESTKRAAAGAIAFEEAGDQLLKGKAAPVVAWRAVRVVAERGGQGRSGGIESPFVGRDDELRLLKDFLHATSRERRVRLISVTGQAGVGKSRLAWELLKYIDGVTEDIYWHQGRSPSFGEGVTFWALGEMIRRRAGLAEGDDDATTVAQIAATLAEYVPDEAERRRIEPALLSLLGVGEPPAGGREELFAAWRTFFERIALRGTTVLVFEDLQWADPGLLEFVDHLLEWSIGYPILVITLARPDLLERRPDWGAGRRNFVALSLGPLSDDAMRELLAGLVPGLPATAVQAILQRADGIPLYAVETIRMLVEDGRLEGADGAYRPVGDLGELEIPDSLQSLIAARLDTLDPADRALLQDGSVLGQTFSTAALAAVADESPALLEPRLRGLVHREILQLDTDPRSPERGQYGFTQALVREVAYATLARRDRRARHLAAARYFESLGDDEVAGVLATHYVDAYEASPEGPEGDAVAAQARIALRAAADRATALGSHESAIGFLERARQVAVDEAEAAELTERIGVAHMYVGHYEQAISTLTAALEEQHRGGDRVAAARATCALASALASAWRASEAIPLLQASEAEVADLAPHPVVVEVRAKLAAAHSTDDQAESIRWADLALEDAEHNDQTALIADLLVTKGSTLAFSGRFHEGTALLDAGFRLAESNGLHRVAARAASNLVASMIDADPRRAVEIGREGLAIARRYGYRPLMLGILTNAIEASLPVGDWGWLERELETVRVDDLEPVDRAAVLVGRTEIDAMRGRPTAAERADIEAVVSASTDLGFIAAAQVGAALVALAEGRLEDAWTQGQAAAADPLNAPLALTVATRAAIRLQDGARASAALDQLVALGTRGVANVVNRVALASAINEMTGDHAGAVLGFREAWRRYQELGVEISLALSQLDCLAVMPPGDPLADEAALQARQILEANGALAYVRQLDALLASRAEASGTRARS